MIEKACPECGASITDVDHCQAIFDQFLALEFTDEAYGQVHFLTVACFMIQHGRYSDEAQAWIKAQLRAHLQDNTTTAEIRRRNAKLVNNSHRDWKVIRKAGDPPAPKITWSMTIIDVAMQYEDAESYCRLIRQWAAATVAEMP